MALVRFGSVTVWGWKGSIGSGFSVPAVPLQKGFSVFQYIFKGKDGSGSGFGSWKTVPAVPVPLPVSGKTVPTVPVPGSGSVPEPPLGLFGLFSEPFGGPGSGGPQSPLGRLFETLWWGCFGLCRWRARSHVANACTKARRTVGFRGRKKPININNFAGLSRKWVGVKLFMCFPFFLGKKGNTINKIPRKSQEKAGRVPGQSRDNPGTIP